MAEAFPEFEYVDRASGSRARTGGYRPDSDVDMCLIVDTAGVTKRSELAALLRAVLDTTLAHWRGTVEADLAAAYERQGCGPACFEQRTWDEVQCETGGQDCFGLYKIQRGYDGFVEQGAELPKMFPCVMVCGSMPISKTCSACRTRRRSGAAGLRA